MKPQKLILHKFHFGDFSIKELQRNLNIAKKLGANEYDVVVNPPSGSHIGNNFIQFYKYLTTEEVVENEIGELNKKINALKSGITK